MGSSASKPNANGARVNAPVNTRVNVPASANVAPAAAPPTVGGRRRQTRQKQKQKQSRQRQQKQKQRK